MANIKRSQRDDVVKTSIYLPRKTIIQLRIKLLKLTYHANVTQWVEQQVAKFLEGP